ncbi:MAG: putative oxidoreductase [Hyphomonadaceae bacterium]|nr:MAG: putative oxidoreductase [Hyphomonadaceae bacterium]KAF0184903.1 MAG: putative oxidoreductase [Hyphomonadaceae bacterium]
MNKLIAPMNWLMARAPMLQSLILLAIRLWLANVFLRSGLLKLGSWESTVSLFATEYQLPFLSPELAAVLGTIVEIGAGGLILFGALTPLAALGLLVLTLTIELLVYPGTNDHYHWMLLLGTLIAFGGGKLSFDGLFFSRLLKPSQTTQNE